MIHEIPFPECASARQVAEAVNEVIRALNTIEAGQPDVQQLKPKMPSLLEAISGIDKIDKLRLNPDYATYRDGLAVMYEYFARHFGH